MTKQFRQVEKLHVHEHSTLPPTSIYTIFVCDGSLHTSDFYMLDFPVERPCRTDREGQLRTEFDTAETIPIDRSIVHRYMWNA